MRLEASGGVGSGLGEALVDDLLSEVPASTATGPQSAGVFEVIHRNSTLVYGFHDLIIGDRFAEADVHRFS
ncbi:MAG: hypothetical protein R3E82_07230 [Pseudomonadales bacterium]